MQFAGVLPEDAPDPRLEYNERLRGLTFPILGLVPQPTVEDTRTPAFAESTGLSGRAQIAVSFTYTLWRNPDDRADPVNLKTLDPLEEAAIGADPPWPRPTWLVEYVERLRYPQLWEAVRTCWTRTPSEHSTLAAQLVNHTNHILVNHFREELGLPPGPTHDRGWQVGTSSVRAAAGVEVDGEIAPAVEIDTDPFVYALGAQIRPDVVTTVVIAREYLPHVRLALQSRDL